MIDQIAQEYSDQPVVVVDYHYSLDYPPPFLPPQARWDVIQATESGLGLTWAVVDSGRLYHRGAETPEVAYNTYTAMINDALTQPATAEINAFWWLDGSTVKITATVTNNCSFTLSTDNNAGVYGIVKENGVRYETHTTQHPGLNAAKTAITSLAPGETATFDIDVPDINPTDWDKVQVIVMVDYQTAPEAHYDQLQAVIANQALYVQPNFHAFFLDDGETLVPDFTSAVMGNAGLSWTAASDQPWLELDSTSGLVGESILMTTNGAAMVPGWNTALVAFTDSSGVYSYEVTVSVYKASPGEVINRIYLPVITSP